MYFSVRALSSRSAPQADKFHREPSTETRELRTELECLSRAPAEFCFTRPRCLRGAGSAILVHPHTHSQIFYPPLAKDCGRCFPLDPSATATHPIPRLRRLPETHFSSAWNASRIAAGSIMLELM